MTDKEKFDQRAEELLCQYLAARMVKDVSNGKADFSQPVIDQYIRDATAAIKEINKLMEKDND